MIILDLSRPVSQLGNHSALEERGLNASKPVVFLVSAYPGDHRK